MGVKVNWLIEGHVIFAQAWGEVNEQDMVAFVTDIKAHLQEAGEGAVIHLIQDVRKITKPYSDLTKIGQLLGTLRKFNGWYLVLDQPGNRFFDMIATISAQIVGVRKRPTYTDYAEIRKFLTAQYPDMTLPETLPDFSTTL